MTFGREQFLIVRWLRIVLGIGGKEFSLGSARNEQLNEGEEGTIQVCFLNNDIFVILLISLLEEFPEILKCQGMVIVPRQK